MSEIQKVWQCVVCGRAWPSQQSLRAHMKAHKSEEYFATKIVVPRPLWTQFKGVCEKHKTTTCQLMKALLEAAVKGDELGVTLVGSQNPFLVQVNHVVLGMPRGRYSHFDGRSMLERLEDPKFKKWPPACEFQGSWWDSDRSVGCLKIKERVSVKECWICFNRGTSLIYP